ncbi:MAG TPA: hypothetical protein VFW70_18605 [Methylomirabilota bacterium]|nr:hypothetical protein [Methylomirabilota bacterium]
MHVIEYTLEVLVRERLGEMRAEAARWSSIRAARPAPRPMRAALGRALIRLGHRMQGSRRYPAPEARRASIQGIVRG